jgi:hypothetical protein
MCKIAILSSYALPEKCRVCQKRLFWGPKAEKLGRQI